MAKVQESSTNLQRPSFPRSQLPAGLGETVARARRARRWSQARLAERAKIARASVYRLEAGQCSVFADTLFRIAHALDIGIGEFVPTWPEWEPIKGNGHGDALRKQRKALDLTMAELSGCLGVSEATLSRHEQGVCVSPEILRRIGEGIVASGEDLATALGFDQVSALERHLGR